MTSLCSVISDILFLKVEYCRLCFHPLGENAVQMQDETVVSSNQIPKTEEMSTILSYVLGANFYNHFTALDNLCNKCARSAISCYNFIKMCKDNCEQLKKDIDTLSESFENVTRDVDTSNTLFVTINTENSTSQHYYDEQSLDTKSAALARFRSFARKPQDNSPKQRKKKVHKFSSETYEICDVIREDNAPTKYKCKVCSNIFSKSFNFKKHYYSMHSPKVLKCPQCPRSYGSESLLKQHIYDGHASMVCSECGKKYTNRYSLMYHMRRHTGEQPYPCQYCEAKFQWSSHRAEHVRRYHLEPGLECDICHAKFKALGSLYDHKKRHYNPNSRMHVTELVKN